MHSLLTGVHKQTNGQTNKQTNKQKNKQKRRLLVVSFSVPSAAHNLTNLTELESLFRSSVDIK